MKREFYAQSDGAITDTEATPDRCRVMVFDYIHDERWCWEPRPCRHHEKDEQVPWYCGKCGMYHSAKRGGHR